MNAKAQHNVDPDIPPGWDYNPASWSQRLPIIVAAVIGFFMAGYLALYQWRVVSWVWEPFFGDGSVRILNSKVSHMFPFPFTDAFLGALGYVADAITGVIGGRARWRTMPWIVIVFGVFVGPLGAISVLLVILQPVMFDAWCTLCLATAIISVVMIGPAMDEFLASLQHLKRAKAQGRSVWGVFWGKDDGPTDNLAADAPASGASTAERSSASATASARGNRGIWARCVSISAGIWLMVAPAALGYDGLAANHDRVIGPLLATFGCIALWEATRPLRWLNLALGLWLLLAPWVLSFSPEPTYNSMATGAVVAAVALFRGRLIHRFDGGWRSLLPGRRITSQQG